MARRRLEGSPGTLPLYARAAAGAIPGAGRLPFVAGGGGELPDFELELDDVAVDRDRLASYCRVCGFGLRESLPATYPHILAFPLHLALLTDGSFPFAPIGLVHIENRIAVRRPIDLRERLSLRVRAGGIEPHPRGRRFSILTEARVGDELVWEEASTELHRGGDGSGSGGRRGGDRAEPEQLPASAEWRLPSDLGRRYAAVSGDRNPIHLHGWAAKPFGFQRAIAHGMWTKARCLAALEGRLPDTFTVEVRLRRPIFLPATVAFASAERDEEIAIAVRDAADGTPHLDGAVTPA